MRNRMCTAHTEKIRITAVERKTVFFFTERKIDGKYTFTSMGYFLYEWETSWLASAENNGFVTQPTFCACFYSHALFPWFFCIRQANKATIRQRGRDAGAGEWERALQEGRGIQSSDKSSQGMAWILTACALTAHREIMCNVHTFIPYVFDIYLKIFCRFFSILLSLHLFFFPRRDTFCMHIIIHLKLFLLSFVFFSLLHSYL